MRLLISFIIGLLAFLALTIISINIDNPIDFTIRIVVGLLAFGLCFTIVSIGKAKNTIGNIIAEIVEFITDLIKW